jgi:phosphopantetheinyl transferase
MPQLDVSIVHPQVNSFIWDIKEPLSYFLQRTRLSADEQDEINKLHGRRQTEFVVQRFLLQNFFLDEKLPMIVKTKNGKPVLLYSLDFISVSHSGSLLALSRSKKEHGIDLELLDERIIRLSPKFCSPAELNVPDFAPPIFWYTLIWSCKEALYKVDGLGNLDFRSQIHTYFTANSLRNKSGRGMVKRGEQQMTFELRFELLGDYIFTLAYPMER